MNWKSSGNWGRGRVPIQGHLGGVEGGKEMIVQFLISGIFNQNQRGGGGDCYLIKRKKAIEGEEGFI